MVVVIICAAHALNTAHNIAMNVRVDITGMESSVLLPLAVGIHVQAVLELVLTNVPAASLAHIYMKETPAFLHALPLLL